MELEDVMKVMMYILSAVYYQIGIGEDICFEEILGIHLGYCISVFLVDHYVVVGYDSRVLAVFLYGEWAWSDVMKEEGFETTQNLPSIQGHKDVKVEIVTIWLVYHFRLMKSDFREPVNIESDEMVSMNEMAGIVLNFENKKL
ncbi:UNVERIFIED_CONTAM: GDP-mannose 3,5-epimerase 2 [Sesamum radiatum]|uniref:GDP-mannose 3,5-epimerase 2 n=1 Tax=Sesamum radiatum TaxID=300843 RepID=A0AAW2JTV4_SESRA